MRASVLLLLLVDVVQVCAQEADAKVIPYRPGTEVHDELTLLTGYHQGTHGFAELGFGRNVFVIGHIPVCWGYYLGGEVRVDRTDLQGVKIGAYMTGVFAMGVQLIRYFEGDGGCTVLRPEIGIGVLKAKLTYAYNIGLSQERLPGINTHMLSITYALRLKRLPKDDDRRVPR